MLIVLHRNDKMVRVYFVCFWMSGGDDKGNFQYVYSDRKPNLRYTQRQFSAQYVTA